MTRKIQKITQKIKLQRHSLLQRYDTRELHRLRVNVRRIRGLLKQNPSRKWKKLRRDWKHLIQQTNSARDWDTLVIYTRATLTAEHFDQWEPLLVRPLRRSHNAVKKALQSRLWKETFRRWKAMLRHSGEKTLAPPALADSLADVQQRVTQAQWRALNWNDEASWHGFRIAIKELRYTLDSLQPICPQETRKWKTAIQRCRQMQDDLGEWHDTVVHRGLLAEMAANPKTLESPPLLEIVNSLGHEIRHKADDCLDRVQATLFSNDSLLQIELPRSNPSTMTSADLAQKAVEVAVD